MQWHSEFKGLFKQKNREYLPPNSLLESESTFMAQDHGPESDHVDINHRTENPPQDVLMLHQTCCH